MSTITTQNWDGVSPGGMPANWVASGLNIAVIASAFAISAGNCIGQSVISAGAVADACQMYNVPATAGDVVVSHVVIPFATDGAAYILARANSSYFWNATAYAVEWRGSTATNPGLAIGKFVNGAFSVIGSRLSATFNNTADYTVTFTLTGTTLVARVQRDSDHNYLNSGGTWQAGAADAITLTDATITRSGYAGLAFYTPTLSGGTGTGACSDNFSFTQTDRAATTFYLSALGNDTNNGTTTLTPWATLAKANATALVPGDTVALNGGDTFAGNLVLSGGGTSGNTVTLTSYGTGLGTINAGDGDGVLAMNMGYVHVDNLVVVGSGITITANAPYAATTSAGCGIRFLSTLRLGSRFFAPTVTNCVVNGLHDGILFQTPIPGLKTLPGDSAAFSAPTIGGPIGFDGISDTNNVIHDILVNALVVWGSDTSAAFGGGFLPTGNGTHKNITMNGNQIYNNYGTPVGVGVIAQPIAIFNSSSGTLTGNLMYNCGSTGGKTSADAGGIGAIVVLESDSIIVRQNEAANIQTQLAYDGCGFDADGGATNCLFEYNYSHDNDGAGFQNGVFSGSNTNTGNVFRYNVSARDAKKNSVGGILQWAGSATWHNNTIFVGTPTSGAPSAVVTTGGTAKFYNNVFFVQAGQAQVNNNGATLTCQGNLYWATDGSFKCINGASTRTTLATWRSAESQEKLGGNPVGLWVDPQLRTPATTAMCLPTVPVSALTDGMPYAPSPVRGAGLPVLADFGLAPGAIDFQQLSNTDGGSLSIGAITAVTPTWRHLPLNSSLTL